MNLQDLLRVLNCLSYEEFNTILNGTWKVEDHRKVYTDEKWDSFRKNLANFLMELDSGYFALFTKFAEVKYERQCASYVKSIIEVSNAVKNQQR
jgi:vacuolar-type H+-ATPase subunit C/Vma6